MTFKNLWKKLDMYPGHFFPGEAEELYKATLKVPKNGVVVELGCFHGKSSIVLAEACLKAGAKLTCVDNFCADGKDAREKFTKNVLDVYDNVTLIVADTNNAIKSWKKKIDLIFIDANHQDDGIDDDCKNWLPFVKKRGFAAFHDYHNENFPSVRKRVDEHTKGWKFVAGADSIMIRKK